MEKRFQAKYSEKKDFLSSITGVGYVSDVLKTELWETRSKRGYLLASFVTRVLPSARLNMSK